MKARTETFTKLEQEFGDADRLRQARFLRIRRGRGLAAAPVHIRLDLPQAKSHPLRHALVDSHRAQDGMHLALHLAVARALHARPRRTAEIAVVVPLRLRCEEAADAH